MYGSPLRDAGPCVRSAGGGAGAICRGRCGVGYGVTSPYLLRRVSPPARSSGWKLRRRLRHLRTCGPRTRRATRRPSYATRRSACTAPHRAPPPRLFRVPHLPRSSGFQPESRSEADADLRPCGRRLGLEAASALASPPHLRPAHTTRNPQAELRDEEECMTALHRAPTATRDTPVPHAARVSPRTVAPRAVRAVTGLRPQVAGCMVTSAGCRCRACGRLAEAQGPYVVGAVVRATASHLHILSVAYPLRRVARASSPSREAKQICAHAVADAGGVLMAKHGPSELCGG